jgi:hypothetical protein
VRRVPRIYQLRIHSYLIGCALHAAFEQVRNSELLADVAQVPRRSALILQNRAAADYFEVGNFRQVSENFVLHAVSEIGVFLFAAQVLKRQHGNALIHDGRVGARRSSEQKNKRSNDCGEHEQPESNFSLAHTRPMPFDSLEFLWWFGKINNFFADILARPLVQIAGYRVQLEWSNNENNST